MSTNVTITETQTYEKCMESVLKHWTNIEHVLYPCKNANTTCTSNQYYELCVLAINQNHKAFTKIQQQTFDICKYAVKKDGYLIADVKLQTPELCLEAVTNRGLALSRCDYQTLEICLTAVKNTGIALSYVMEQFMTFEICLVAVKKHGESLKDIPKNIMNSFNQEQITELHMAAIQGDVFANALQYVNPKTLEICIEALKKNILTLKYVPAHIKEQIGNQKITELTIEAMKKNHYTLRDIKNQTFEICLAAVKMYGDSIRDIDRDTLLNFTVTEAYEICIEAIKADKSGYVYLPDCCMARFNKEQKYNIVLEKAKISGDLPKQVELEQYTNEQIYELQLAAVKKQGRTLSQIKNQTPELCFEAVKQDYYAFACISDDMLKVLDEKQMFELRNLAYNQGMNQVQSTKDTFLKNLFTYLKIDNTMAVKITDVLNNKKTYNILNGELLDFVKVQNSNAILISDITNVQNEGLYIIKINDDCYELVKTDKTVEVVKGWIYNGTKNITNTQKIAIYKKTILS